MSDWIEQYSAALDARDAREQAHKPYIDAYTKLADRAAAQRATAAAAAPTPSAPNSPRPLDRNATPSKGGGGTAKPPSLDPTTPADLLSTLRADLATTQKGRTTLQTRVDELGTTLSQLQVAEKRSTSQISLLTRQKIDTERKLRDREEEIKGKAKLVEEAQDEMVSLQLQLNMAEQRSDRLEKENKELVDRWMKRMGEEAEKVNRGSGWE